jgi:hypothetical protein
VSIHVLNPLHPWQRIEDDQGEPCFVNMFTDETVWELPAVLHTEGGWQKLLDDESGDCYWFCEASGETTWDDPLAPVRCVVSKR